MRSSLQCSLFYCNCSTLSVICRESAADLGLVSLLIKCLDMSQRSGVSPAVAKQFRTKCILALSICVDQCGKQSCEISALGGFGKRHQWCDLLLQLFLRLKYVRFMGRSIVIKYFNMWKTVLVVCATNQLKRRKPGTI